MNIEQDFFKRKRPDFTKLKAAGFRYEDGRAVYRKAFFDEQFLAELFIDESGAVSGRVMDLDTGEEYLPIRVEDYAGGFVGTVREKYLELLGTVSDACFVSYDFAYDQSNRIAAGIGRTYGISPEFPWEKYPENGIFKRPDNDKWFVALLPVARGKLTPAADEAEADRIVEVVNLKADPEAIPELITRPGIYNGWHMNKKHWISVVLDDTLTDEAVLQLIEDSWRLVAGGKKSGHVTGDAWIIPSNPALYDVDAGFAETGELEWHQHNNIKPGDELYIYSSAPNSAILYKCEVTASDLHYHGMFQGKDGYDRSMRIRLVERYPNDLFPLRFMKAHGGSAIRGARRMPEELLRAMREKLK